MITFDPAKSERNRALRGLPFEMASEFEFETAIINQDTRFSYPEIRYLATGDVARRPLFDGVYPPASRISRDFSAPSQPKGAAYMASKPNPGLIDDDAPEFTDEQLAGMRPARDVLPPDFYAMVTKRKPGQRGPGKKPAKVAMTVRVDADTLAAWKASGTGWQRRVNEVLRSAVKKGGARSGRKTSAAKRA